MIKEILDLPLPGETRSLLFRIRYKEPVSPFIPVGRNSLLPFPRYKPFDELHCLPVLYVLVPVGIDRHHAILIEEERVSLHHDRHVQPVPVPNI